MEQLHGTKCIPISFTTTVLSLLKRSSFRVKWIKSKKEEIMLYLFITVYTVIFSYYTIMKMYALKASAWDLGNYNQALYTFVFHRMIFYWTADILNNPSGSLFGIHVSPLFFFLAPFYALLPKSETLLVIQSFALAMGAAPCYYLACYYLSSKRLGLMFALLYLINPVIIGINWSEFHPEAFIPVAVLFFIYSYCRKEWKKLLVSLILALSIMGEVAIMIAFFALYIILSTLIQKRHSVYMKTSTVELRLPVLIFFVSFAWFLISIRIKFLFNPSFPLYFGSVGSWRVLGAKNILEIPKTVLLNPFSAVQALSYDWTSKLLYLLILFGSCGFLSIFSPIELFPSIVWLIPSLLSDNPAYYTLGLQYPAFLMPFIIYSSILGMKNVMHIFRKISLNHVFHRKFSVFILIPPLIFFLLSNPFFGLNLGVHEWGRYGYPFISPSAHSARYLSELIPQNASVFASHNIFPLISSRLEAYTLPWVIDYGTASYFTYAYELVRKVDFILLDLINGLDPSRNALVLSLSRDFGVLAYSNGILLLKRGYQGSPIVYEPYREVFDYRRLVIRDGFLVYDNTSKSGKVLAGLSLSNTSRTDFWWGPYVMLPPGEYNITFYLKCPKLPLPDEELLTIDASAFILKVKAFLVTENQTGAKYIDMRYESTQQKIEFPGMTVKGYMFNSTGYQPFSIKVTLNVFGIYEFRGMNLKSKVPLFLDRIEVQQIRPLSYFESVPIQFESYSEYLMDWEHASFVIECSNLLTETEPLMIQDDLLAFVNYKGAVYPISSSIEAQSKEAFLNQLDLKLNQTKYIMLDWKSNPALSYLILSRPIVSSEFGTKAWADGVILLERDYLQDPILFKPFNKTIPLETLTLLEGTSLVKDSATGDTILVHTNVTRADFWWGPYIMLPPGNYQAIYRLKASEVTPDNILTLKVYLFPAKIEVEIIHQEQDRYKPHIFLNQTDRKIEIESKEITGLDIYTTQRHVEFVLNFTAVAPGIYEFPGRFVKTDTNIYLYQIQILMTKPLP